MQSVRSRLLLLGGLANLPALALVDHYEAFHIHAVDYTSKATDINCKLKRKHTDVPFWCKRK